MVLQTDRKLGEVLAPDQPTQIVRTTKRKKIMEVHLATDNQEVETSADVAAMTVQEIEAKADTAEGMVETVLKADNVLKVVTVGTTTLKADNVLKVGTVGTITLKADNVLKVGTAETTALRVDNVLKADTVETTALKADSVLKVDTVETTALKADSVLKVDTVETIALKADNALKTADLVKKEIADQKEAAATVIAVVVLHALVIVREAAMAMATKVETAVQVHLRTAAKRN
jgi:hypothetical protein